MRSFSIADNRDISDLGRHLMFVLPSSAGALERAAYLAGWRRWATWRKRKDNDGRRMFLFCLSSCRRWCLATRVRMVLVALSWTRRRGYLHAPLPHCRSHFTSFACCLPLLPPCLSSLPTLLAFSGCRGTGHFFAGCMHFNFASAWSTCMAAFPILCISWLTPYLLFLLRTFCAW